MISLFFSLLLVINPVYQSTMVDTLTLEQAYQSAYENYPTAKKITLQNKITAINLDIINTGYYPQITVNGKATYQSEVPHLGSGGSPFPTISKDQYEASVNVTQTIYNGGVTGIQKELQQAKGRQQVNSIEVSLYQIRGQVNQVYYGILLSQKQLKSTMLVIKNLQKQFSTIKSKVKHGVMLASKLHVLEAELIKARQDSAAIQSNTKAGYDVLGLLMGGRVAFGTPLRLPEININYQALKPLRPRLSLFKSSINLLQTQEELAAAKKWPRLSAFGKAAYGRPGFNFLKDDLHGYYMVGLTLQWDVWDFVNSDRHAEILQIKQQQVVQDQKGFLLQVNTKLQRIKEDIQTINENIKRDKKIAILRKQIVEASASQLKYGVITASDYVTALTKLSRAQLSLFINRVQLSQAKMNYLTTLGIPLK